MIVTLDHISKKYNREYIFRDLSYVFEHGKSYAITGSNGSGKSTLLQVIGAYIRPSAGRITYNDGAIDEETLFNHVGIATPYLELVEEFTLSELIDFHFNFKKPLFSKDEILEKAYLVEAKDKFVKNFSSGMKQRLKLSLTLFSENELLLLDEPTSNLDAQGVNWYREQLKEILTQKETLTIIASNQSHEYDFCDQQLNVESYKHLVT